MRDRQSGSGVADEIDLWEFTARIWSYKAVIFSSVLLCFFCSLVYVFLAKPQYDARAFILPPSQSDIANFNYGRTRDTELSRYEVNDVFAVFLRNFQGESLRREFFTSTYLPSLAAVDREKAVDELYAEFSRKFVLSQGGSGAVTRYSVTVRNADPATAKAWAEQYVQRAGAVAKAEMIKNVTLEAEVRARNLAQKIDTLRDSGQKVREDLIVKLQEAREVAKAVGLEKPPLISGTLSSEVSASMDGELTYMRGSQALDAAIKTLEARKSDDPFIKGLRELQVSYSFYRNLEVRPDSVEVYQLDGPIELPDEQSGPQKAIILALGVFVGLLVGLMLAAVRIVLLDRRKV
ncbi:MAG: hypothetical protein LBJ37_02195 [Paucimonas sp.]|jgi:chain length determinant protein (polysaccharide antigen chain regulator)|nr:hypothetical protein [Paucimonas sp.]